MSTQAAGALLGRRCLACRQLYGLLQTAVQPVAQQSSCVACRQLRGEPQGRWWPPARAPSSRPSGACATRTASGPCSRYPAPPPAHSCKLHQNLHHDSAMQSLLHVQLASCMHAGTCGAQRTSWGQSKAHWHRALPGQLYQLLARQRSMGKLTDEASVAQEQAPITRLGRSSISGLGLFAVRCIEVCPPLLDRQGSRSWTQGPQAETPYISGAGLECCLWQTCQAAGGVGFEWQASGTHLALAWQVLSADVLRQWCAQSGSFMCEYVGQVLRWGPPPAFA